MSVGGKSPRVTVLGKFGKFQKIARPVDNTDDLLAKVEATHARYSKIKAPNGTGKKSATKGAFDPTDNTAFNGNTVTAPNT